MNIATQSEVNSAASFQAPDSLSEQIARYVGKQIITGELVSRQRIQEQKITSSLGVSRGSVREALLILERRHLVEILPRKGAMVSPLALDDVNALYDFYASLLTMLVIRLAAMWKTHEELIPLLQRIETMRDVEGGTSKGKEELIEGGFDLMRAASAMVNNPFLYESLENLRPAVHRTYYLAMQGRYDGYEHNLQFFQSLVDGVLNRDMDLLVKAVEDFAENQRKVVIEAL